MTHGPPTFEIMSNVPPSVFYLSSFPAVYSSPILKRIVYFVLESSVVHPRIFLNLPHKIYHSRGGLRMIYNVICCCNLAFNGRLRRYLVGRLLLVASVSGIKEQLFGALVVLFFFLMGPFFYISSSSSCTVSR